MIVSTHVDALTRQKRLVNVVSSTETGILLQSEDAIASSNVCKQIFNRSLWALLESQTREHSDLGKSNVEKGHMKESRDESPLDRSLLPRDTNTKSSGHLTGSAIKQQEKDKAASIFEQSIYTHAANNSRSTAHHNSGILKKELYSGTLRDHRKAVIAFDRRLNDAN